MTRMYLRVPSTSCEPGRPCNRYYFDNGEMVDLTADVRCATCANWYTEEDDPYGECTYFSDLTERDFGCVRWEHRVIPILTKTQQTDDTLDHVTQSVNKTEQTGDIPANHVTPDSNPDIETGDTTEDMGS